MKSTLLHFLGITLVLLWGLVGSSVRADHLTIDRAVLISGGIDREVSLPHTLGPSDFDPDGAIVTYRLTFNMPADAEGAQAIYISKLGLSGQLIRSGQLIWSCGAAELSQLRCLHRPHLIQLPAGFLDPGHNVLDFEIYADSRQMNGLSPVIVGPYSKLLYKHYRLMRFLKTDLVQILAIFAGVAGFLSLAVGLTGQRDRLFLVFGAAAIFELLAAFAVLAVDPVGNREITSWLVFTGRFVAVLLKLVLFYEAFGRLTLRDPLVVSLLLLMVIGPVAFAVTDSNRSVVIALYSVVALCIAVTTVRIARWTYLDPTLRNIAWSTAAVLIFGSSLHDYLRLGGAATFDGAYLLFYVFPIVMIIMGLILFARMGTGLRVAQNFTLSLHKEVAERTAELQSALTSIQNLEASALRLTRNIPIGTFILQTWGHETARFVFFSDRLRKMINLPQQVEQPLFASWERLLHPDDVARLRATLRQAIDDETSVEAEFRIRSAEGNWCWLRWIMLPQPGSVSPLVWDGVVIDVTEARKAEERLHIANAGLVEVTAEKSRMAERDRLLQEMHDGFGSQLSSARLAIEQGGLEPEEVARILLECSQDLRIMVDTLGNEDGDLANAIADFRYRTERRLLGTGITLNWNIAVDDQTRLAPTVILQILRVLQEAQTNALRHSGAGQVTVSVKASQGRLIASVADNGRGIDSHARGGRGMANMRKRCREIGARLQVTDTEPGTLVELTMDLLNAH
jgi:signal transduction histidine kinase